MEDQKDEASGPTRRQWTVFMACAWLLLGVWSLSAGDRWIGVMWLALAGLNVAVLLSPRAAARMDAPLFSKKR